MVSCATPRSSSPHSELPVSKSGPLDRHSATKEIEDSRRLLEAGAPAQAIPRLQHTMSKFPNSDAAADARYYLALCYHALHSYHDAIEMFADYLRMAPEGPYAKSAEEHISRLTREYDKRYLSSEELETNISTLTKQAEADPSNLELQWELGHLLWKRGNYGKAARYYLSVAEVDPTYADRDEFKERIELMPDGQHIVLSPAELDRRLVERQPLQIINTSSFQSGHERFTRLPKHYVVTGQVHNRGDSVLYGVQVIVTIYGFGNVVYDTNTVTIGRMNPGEFRAYSVRFSNFPNIENVDRSESVPTFQR
jgi:tetratricopeptide (TPR) repeat protein